MVIRRILLGLFVVLIAIQFVRIDKTKPETKESEDFIVMTNPPVDVANLLKSACYDCHSHETNYPWYSNIAPFSFMIEHHIEEAREHLNFSTWATYDTRKAIHKLEECAEEIEKNKMPMESYIKMHEEANLTEAQKERLVIWFASQWK
jgi:hypothetical protein